MGNNEMFDVVNRAKKLREVMFYKSNVFNEEEKTVLNDRSSSYVIEHLNDINDDLDLAIVITNYGLAYTEDNISYNVGITQALLAKQIEMAYGVKSWFMERDINKQPTIYEKLTNDYFDKMFGANGKRQLFTGDAKGFMDDFRKYGATDEEILSFDKAIFNSVFNGEYSLEDDKQVSELCEKISKARIAYESKPEELSEAIKKTL